MAKNSEKKTAAVELPAKTRSYISQSDVPNIPLDQAIRVAEAIGNNYGYKPTPPLYVAKAMDLTPASGRFRNLTGASIAYGLTAGAASADVISIEPLGMRVIRPTVEGDDGVAKREAFLRPRVIREFLEKYDKAPLPKENIAQHVLEDMGVPKDRTADVLNLIMEGAQSVDFLHEVKGGRVYVDLRGTPVATVENGEVSPADTDDQPGEFPTSETKLRIPLSVPEVKLTPSEITPAMPTDVRAKRVFITHGKNQAFITPIQKLLSFGELEAVVSVRTQTVSQPVPGKVMEEMRSCGAAIIHVEDERHLLDKDANEHVVLNENVLIEIGAAMALYGQRFILIVRDGVKLPSNLQGLLELRYKGDTLDMEETVKLLEAINDMKKRLLP